MRILGFAGFTDPVFLGRATDPVDSPAQTTRSGIAGESGNVTLKPGADYLGTIDRAHSPICVVHILYLPYKIQVW